MMWTSASLPLQDSSESLIPKDLVPKHNVCICYQDGFKSDNDVSFEIRSHLKEEETVDMVEVLTGNDLDVFTDVITLSNSIIIVLSNESISEFWLLKRAHLSLFKRKVTALGIGVIVVLNDMKEEQVTEDLCPLICVSKSDNYLKTLVNIISGLCVVYLMHLLKEIKSFEIKAYD